MQSKPSALDNLFHELARKRLSDWVDFAEARLKGTGVKCYITGGNDDYPDTLAPLQREDLVRVVGCEGKEVQVRRKEQHDQYRTQMGQIWGLLRMPRSEPPSILPPRDRTVRT